MLWDSSIVPNCFVVLYLVILTDALNWGLFKYAEYYAFYTQYKVYYPVKIK